MTECPACGGTLSPSSTTRIFEQFGPPVAIETPALSCRECGDVWFTGREYRETTAAFARHFGHLTAVEIESHGIPIATLAERTGIPADDLDRILRGRLVSLTEQDFAIRSVLKESEVKPN